MSEKSIAFFSLVAVIAVGIVSFIGMNEVNTGATIIEKACCCEITQFDFYGNPMGVHVQPVRVRSFEAYNDAACNNRCDIMFGRGRTVVTGYAC